MATTYTREQIAAISRKLRKMPEKPKDVNYSKQNAIEVLAGDIEKLQQKGYTLDQISETLKGEGLDITVGTLKSYLTKIKAGQEAKRVAKSGNKTSGSVSQKPKDTPPPAPAQPVVNDGRIVDDNRASFAVKPDTDDL